MFKRNFYSSQIIVFILLIFLLPAYSQLVEDGIEYGTVLKSPHPSRPLRLECISDGRLDDRNYLIVIPTSSDSTGTNIGYLGTRFLPQHPHLMIEKLSIAAPYQRQNYGLQALETLFYTYQQKPLFPLEEYVALVSPQDPAVQSLMQKLGARPNLLMSGMVHMTLMLLNQAHYPPRYFVTLPRAMAEKRVMLPNVSVPKTSTPLAQALRLAGRFIPLLKK